ncbi:MAG TPA: hypothetical protein VJZ00_00315 [Thermoanaerobaculia bacterium]|nr:hypothetical protein [Thermoanaerobaculia bacterium]
MNCPSCGSEKTRRGGNVTWVIYVALIALAILAVLRFQLNAALVGGIMIAIVLLAHLLLGERVCIDCGHQWRA